MNRRHVIPPAVKYAARHGYAWPGGYEMHTIFSDGGRLCYQCTAAEWREIAHDTVKGWASGWRAIDAAINWEGDDLHCDQCNRPIEPVYGTVEDAED